MTRPTPHVCTTEAEWHAARWEGIGASEAADLIEKPYSLWAEKVGLVERKQPNNVDRLEEGHLAEPMIAELVKRRCGVKRIRRSWEVLGLDSEPHDVVFSDAEHDWLRATPDYFIQAEDGSSAVCEMKFWDAFSRELWVNGPPLGVFLQVQQQMEVLQVPRALIAPYFGVGRFEPIWVDREPKWTALLRQRGSDLWARVAAGRRALEAGEDPHQFAPEAVSRLDLDALKRFKPREDTEVEIPQELAERFAAAHRARKEADDAYSDVQAELRKRMVEASATVATHSDEKLATLKTNARGTVTFRPAI